jgi:Fic family protein
MSKDKLCLLPPESDIETKVVLKKLASTHRYLAELKGVAATIPNEGIILNTLALQEAKDSSEIENIITTHDEMYKADVFDDFVKNPAAKEVGSYASALRKGFDLVRQGGVITTNIILEIQEELEGNSAGLRKLPGTALVSDKTGKTIYTPPQSHDEIVELMKNLERFINDDSMSDVDLLVKMALIHFQFETIHPFYDGNGRTGRIINILYLVLKGLLDIPVLYLSRYIIQNKDKYYELLQVTRETGQWEQWLLYMLEGVEMTSQQTIKIIKQIKVLMMDYKHRIRKELPKIYSQDLLNNIFRHPYTKIDLMKEEIGVGRRTATKYLNQLTESGFLEKHKFGTHYFYVNRYLLNLLVNIPEIKK